MDDSKKDVPDAVKTEPNTESATTPVNFEENLLSEPAAPAAAAVQTPAPKKGKKGLFIALIAGVLLIAGGAAAFFLTRPEAKKTTTTTAPTTTNKKTIVYAVHWIEDYQINGVSKDGKLVSKGLKQYLDEYNKLNPEVNVVAQQIEYSKYADKLRVLNDSGAGPDIYQIYSPWGASYVRDNVLAEPPADVIKDVQNNYVSYAGATIDNKIWGFPTEVNNYALLYNKDLFKQAGIVDAKGEALAPKTWQDVQNAAAKLTKRDTKGNITQYGISFLKENDWQVVDPFLSLLYSKGGSFLSKDYKQAQFNGDAGVAALDAQLALFKNGSTDLNGNFYDFGKGKVGMVISPPWPKSAFAEAFGDKFSTTVGVAPFPYINQPATLQYSWFMGVMKNSEHKDESWKFLKWFTTEIQTDTGTTRYGDLLANTIGAIPARKVDFNSHKVALGDFFTSTFVNQMPLSTAEPNVMQASQIKAALMTEIQSAWAGQKTSKQALDSAAAAVNKILAQYY